MQNKDWLNDLKPGDLVTWRSHGGPSRKTKIGVIVAVVPRGMRAAEVVPSELRKLPWEFDGMARRHKSYLVAVEPPEGRCAMRRLYWPRVVSLRPAKLVDEPEAVEVKPATDGTPAVVEEPGGQLRWAW